MKIIVTGRSGQLGWELQQTQNTKDVVTYFNSKELDITNVTQVNEIITMIRPDLVINAAAYTAVDKAETDAKQAYAVNETGVKNLALACKVNKAKFIHVSTDFVFDGSKNTPYLPDDETNPVSVYGASKLAGEQHVQTILGDQACIIRTAWVYSSHGNNFVKTMLRLMSEKEDLGVVVDQIGTPTWAKSLAKMIWKLAEEMTRPMFGCTLAKESGRPSIYHWSDAGIASWYDFAVTIQDIGFEKGMLDKKIPIKAIPSSAYPTPANRPSYSVLDCVNSENWRKQLLDMMSELKAIDNSN